MLHIITGAPCSGKSTYVREHAKAGDVRVDFDVIAQALGSDVDHQAEGAVRECAFKARSAAINYLIEHADECEGWIIHSDPADWQREAYEKVGAEFIDLDVDMQTCLDRAVEDERPEGEADAIRDWFARHEKGTKMPMYKMASGEAAMPADGIVEGYASTFDREPDSYGDVVAKGAFEDSLARWRESGKPIPLLYGHSTDDPEYNIGKVIDAYEDERGLFVRAEFDADNPKAQYVRKLVKEGRLYQFSFAYQVLDAGTVELDSGLEAYELRKLDIFEVSLVQIPANQHAEVVEVKAATPEVKSGRRNSKADEDELRRVLDMANQIETIVQSLIGDEQDEPEPEPEDKPEEPEGAKGEDSTAKAALAQLKDEADRLLRQ